LQSTLSVGKHIALTLLLIVAQGFLTNIVAFESKGATSLQSNQMIKQIYNLVPLSQLQPLKFSAIKENMNTYK
jgi:hypothetical protein